ncbi:MAG: hypothetical protein N3A38_01090 [Planctomycetota bacterium]|nr:hypothetical protein [Planctomycetota bacterium]
MDLRGAVEKLVALAPERAGAFEGSAYACPLATALFGEQPPAPAELSADLPAAIGDGGVEKLLSGGALPDGIEAGVEPPAAGDRGTSWGLLDKILALAEYIESVQPDRSGFFISDSALRGCVATGTAWRRGWVLLAGGGGDEAAAARIERAGFMCFRCGTRLESAKFNLGDRETSGIYFGQMMARYGTIYGRIAPGDVRDLKRFLAGEVPAAIVALGALRPVETLIVMGLAGLGAPAAVPPDFPAAAEGRFARAGSFPEALQALEGFPNLRVREKKPDLRMAFATAATVRSVPPAAEPLPRGSFLQARLAKAGASIGAPEVVVAGPCANRAEGARPRAQTGPAADGDASAGGRAFGVVIEVADPAVRPGDTRLIEEIARGAVERTPGIRPAPPRPGDPPWALRGSAAPESLADRMGIGQKILDALAFSLPKLKRVRVTVFSDPEETAAELAAAAIWDGERRKAAEVEDADPDAPAVVCTECRATSREGICILLPERPPACGSKSYRQARLAALFGADMMPFRRRSDADKPLYRLVVRGQCLDPSRGEWKGINEAAAEVTDGCLSRIYMHSVRDFPHPSCGAFRMLAFWIREVGGIGLMSRSFRGRSPDGRTWEMLANAADGKQCPGVSAVSLEYIRSPHFLRGDGGRGNIVWASGDILASIRDVLPPGSAVADENEAPTTEKLREFLDSRRARPT